MAADALALWLLLHSTKRDRALIDLVRPARVVILPAGCEESAARRVAVHVIVDQDPATGNASGVHLASGIVDALSRSIPTSPNPPQFLVRGAHIHQVS